MKFKIHINKKVKRDCAIYLCLYSQPRTRCIPVESGSYCSYHISPFANKSTFISSQGLSSSNTSTALLIVGVKTYIRNPSNCTCNSSAFWARPPSVCRNVSSNFCLLSALSSIYRQLLYQIHCMYTNIEEIYIKIISLKKSQGHDWDIKKSAESD